MPRARAQGPALATLGAALLCSGLGVLTLATPAQAATAILYVRPAGASTTCTGSSLAAACGDLQDAIDAAAAPGFAGDDVIINVAPGTYSPAAPPTVAAGTEASLTIRGAGADGPNATVLETATGATRVGLQITAGFPVTVRALRIQGSGPAATGAAGLVGADTIGIDESSGSEVTVRAVRITGLTGGTGGAGAPDGGDGGNAVGIKTGGGGDTTIIATQIDGLVGGIGGSAAAGGALNINGQGGNVVGILADPGTAAARTVVRNSQISGNTGGSGTATPALRTRRGHGGDAFGIRFVTGVMRLESSTLADNSGGNGATGGAGIGAPIAQQNAGIGGNAGNGFGLDARGTAQDLVVRDSTITANNGGTAGAGGTGYTTSGGTGDGGVGGDGGRGTGIRTAITANPPVLVHLTVVDNWSALGGPGGVGSPPGAAGPSAAGYGIQENGANPRLSASLLRTQGSANTNCDGTINDRGFNVVSDPTSCVPVPGDPARPNLLSTFANGTDDELGPLTDNGGPTQTIAIQPDSTMATAVTDSDLCRGNQNGKDQRGAKRPSPCAAGAYEPNPVGKSARHKYGRGAAAPSTGDLCGAVTTRPNC